jgi:hypothetical protein
VRMIEQSRLAVDGTTWQGHKLSKGIVIKKVLRPAWCPHLDRGESYRRRCSPPLEALLLIMLYTIMRKLTCIKSFRLF